jgi:Uma2 family endonuclease
MASPDNTEADSLSIWLGGMLDLYLEALELGRLFGSRVAFRLSADDSPEPDLAIVLKHRLHLVRRGFVNGRPDVAIEIVSPESVERDYVQKRELYQSVRVPEYWIVDEMQEKVALLRLGSDGKYREAQPRKGVLRSRVLQGFWLRPQWLWQSPRPKKTTILAQILGHHS